MQISSFIFLYGTICPEKQSMIYVHLNDLRNDFYSEIIEIEMILKLLIFW